MKNLTEAFLQNFSRRGELGASVSVWKDGEEIASLHQGYTTRERTHAWTESTLVPVFSATKGAASASLLLALHRHGYTPSTPVGDLWPSFPLPKATIAEAMSHQCGLAAFRNPASIFDHKACVQSLEETTPAWHPPHHGYHPQTFGIILDELMVRLTGERIMHYWEKEIRSVLNIDFYMDLPYEKYPQVATLYPGKADQSNLNTPFYRQYLKAGTPIFKAFHSLLGLGSVNAMNSPSAWTSGSPSLGGVASARGMAVFYQACMGFITPDLFPPIVREWMQHPITNGKDLTLLEPTAYACGMMVDPIDEAGAPIRSLFGINGFGHAGAGGSLALASPGTGISFAYTMNQMDLNVLPGEKTTTLTSTLPIHSC